MPVSGLKNKFAKAGQYMSEKVLKADHTKKDEEYQEMEKAVDAMALVAEHMSRDVTYILQPNPTERMKVAARRKVKSDKAFYPYEEGPLGESMLKAVPDMTDRAPHYASGLESAGNAFKELADERDNLTVNVQQNFVEPLSQFLQRDIKEIAAHRKKMESRRLNFDAKRRKMAGAKGGNSGVTEEELREAEAKFEESYDLAAEGMSNLLDAEGEQLAQLSSLLEILVDSHQSSIRILEAALESVKSSIDTSGATPRNPRTERRKSRPLHAAGSESMSHDDSSSHNAASSSTFFSGDAHSTGGEEPYCVALFDFEPENDGELGFSEGDRIELVSRIDENWLEGRLNGETGFFPCNYVEVKKDI